MPAITSCSSKTTSRRYWKTRDHPPASEPPLRQPNGVGFQDANPASETRLGVRFTKSESSALVFARVLRRRKHKRLSSSFLGVRFRNEDSFLVYLACFSETKKRQKHSFQEREILVRNDSSPLIKDLGPSIFRPFYHKFRPFYCTQPKSSFVGHMHGDKRHYYERTFNKIKNASGKAVVARDSVPGRASETLSELRSIRLDSLTAVHI